MIDLDVVSAAAIETAFAAVPTAVALCTYYKNVSGQGSEDYDVEEDTVIAPLGVIENVRMIKVSAEEGELVGTSVTVNDAKFLVPGVDLPNIRPETVDYFDHRGTRYNVIKIKPIPTTALHIIFGRAR